MSNENKKKSKPATQITMPHSAGEVAGLTGILAIIMATILVIAAQNGYWPSIKKAIGLE